MSTMTSSLMRTVAVAALLGGLAFAPVQAANVPNVAPTVPASDPAAAPQDADSTAPSSAMQAAPAPQAAPEHGKMSMDEAVENRIKILHEKLMITADQETAWGTVAQAMRDNEQTIKSLIEERHQNGATMTAVEDMQSYQKIAQAHADGLGKVATAFSPLYDAMSDTQKKNADEVFGRFEGHRGPPSKGPKSKHKTSTSN